MTNTVKLPAEEVTYSWREIKLPEELTPEQARGVRPLKEDAVARQTSGMQYVAIDSKGRAIINNFSGESMQGRTPEQAWLAGQLAQEGNALGHCVGGYADEVAAGQSRILSLRDHLGRSYATVEIQPTIPRSPVSTFYAQASPDFLARHPISDTARYQSDFNPGWVEFKSKIAINYFFSIFGTNYNNKLSSLNVT